MAYAAANPQGEKPKRAPQLAKLMEGLIQYEQAGNIAEMLDQEQLTTIGYDVEREYKIDKQSREEWEGSAERAMNVAMQVRQPKNYPFPGAANIKYPLVTVAALQFGARAYRGRHPHRQGPGARQGRWCPAEGRERRPAH
jgi:chaperonin GroES